MADIDTDFLEAFGLTQADVDNANNDSGDSGDTNANPDAQTAQDADNVTNDASNQDASLNSTPDTEQGDENQTQQQTQAQDTGLNQRANSAFAQMRTENTALKRLVNDIAGVLGIDPNTPQAQMQSAVQDAIIKAQAKQQNIDPALLQRMTQLEQYKEQSEMQSLRNRALMGFQTVKNQFNLSDAELDDFADKLAKDGHNPFREELDLVSEYKLRNFDALIAAAEERGAAKEATRTQRVAAHSSQPGKTTGASTNTEAEPINSVSGLTNWFDNNTK